MKKLIAMVFTAILLFGCEPESQKTIYSSDGTILHARKFVYEGHQYIEFYRSSGFSYDNYTGFVHDPDCPCMIDYD